MNKYLEERMIHIRVFSSFHQARVFVGVVFSFQKRFRQAPPVYPRVNVSTVRLRDEVRY